MVTDNRSPKTERIALSVFAEPVISRLRNGVFMLTLASLFILRTSKSTLTAAPYGSSSNGKAHAQRVLLVVGHEAV